MNDHGDDYHHDHHHEQQQQNQHPDNLSQLHQQHHQHHHHQRASYVYTMRGILIQRDGRVLWSDFETELTQVLCSSKDL